MLSRLLRRRGWRRELGYRLALCGAMAFLMQGAVQAAETVRLYPCGEEDPDGDLGEIVFETLDVHSPPTEDVDGAPVTDALGEFVTLVASGEPIYVEGRADEDGETGLAIEFDGVDDILTSGPFDPRNSGTFASLSQAWVKPAPSGSGVRQAVWSLGNDNGGVGITADGKWEIIASSLVPDTPSSADVEFGEWTHVAVLRGGNGASLYVNGALVASGDNFWNGVGDVTVGSRTSPGNEAPFFGGVIDDFQIAGFSDGTFDPVADIRFFEGDVSDVFADVNQDRVVNIDDYLVWSENVGFDSGLGGGDGNTLRMGDVDQNGRIDYHDFEIIVTEAGRAVDAAPEASGLIAAEDFIYNQPTKVLGPGGGFTLQDYDGGQGAWTTRWVSIGNGIITGDSDGADRRFAAFTTTGLSANSLNRTFSLAGLTEDQEIYFSALVKIVPDQSPVGRLVVNAPGDEEAEVSIGFDPLLGFDARVGPDIQVPFDVPIIVPGEFHRLVGKLQINADGGSEVLTAWFDPEDVESGDFELVAESDIVGAVDELTGQLSLDRGTSGGGGLIWDDVAVGTSWASVTSIEVPRLRLEIDRETGEVSFVNSTQSDFDLKYYELTSPSGSLSPDGWSSLSDLPFSTWRKNSATANLLVESNFSQSRKLAAQSSLSVGQVYTPGAELDLVARIGTAQGLLNLAPGDRDEDSVVDPADNCVDVANANQQDVDSDGIGDVCDNCPEASNRGQVDLDGDGVGNVCDTEIADTWRDWSVTGEQGENNLFYGYFDVSEDLADGGDGVYDGGKFTEFLNDGTEFITGDAFGWRDGSNHWNGRSWDLTTAADAPWTAMGRLDVHPNDPDPEAEHWVVRRWESDQRARVSVLWHMHHEDVDCGGNGVGALLYHNDTLVDEATIAGGDSVGVTRSVEITARAGDTIDLLLTPVGPDGVSDDGCDGSQNWFLVDRIDDGGREFRRGDPDDSGSANISDAVGILNFLFAGANDPVCMEAADVNDDGQINVSDPVVLLDFLFSDRTSLPAPGASDCGPDRPDSPSDLGCETYSSCDR